jgi:hypothetical protein
VVAPLQPVTGKLQVVVEHHNPALLAPRLKQARVAMVVQHP